MRTAVAEMDPLAVTATTPRGDSNTHKTLKLTHTQRQRRKHTSSCSMRAFLAFTTRAAPLRIFVTVCVAGGGQVRDSPCQHRAVVGVTWR